MNPTRDAIEQKIVASLRQLDEQWESIGEGKAVWTRAIKEAVGGVGKSLDYEVYAAQCKYEANGEWLFDLSWIHQDGEIILDMPLALESEWDPRGILEDFQKLLVSRAIHRVMVFWQPDPDAWRRCFDQLITQIRTYRGTQSGDRYLFCCWIKDPDELRIQLHIAGAGGITIACT